MKATLKLALALSLFCSIVLADGNQGNTGYTGDCSEPNCPPAPCVLGCGDGGGGFAYHATDKDDTDMNVLEEVMLDTILESVVTFNMP